MPDILQHSNVAATMAQCCVTLNHLKKVEPTTK